VDTLFGVPAHPLIVHVPVVFIPLTLLAAIAAAAWPRGRRVLSIVVLGGALVSFLGAQLATMSGEDLEERVDVTSIVHQHAELGEATRTFAFVMLVVAAVYCAREWAGSVRLPVADRIRAVLAPRAVGTVLVVALVATSALTTAWAVRAGHKGAEATWEQPSGQVSAHLEPAGR
jgi:hypothetical protein